jgi:putative endonuclease
MSRNTKAKRRAWRRGRKAETLCVWYLRLHGYRILARDFRVPVGEIDIIARRGRTLAMIEVKARDSIEAALSALEQRQQNRIARAATAFLMTRPGYVGLDIRFDVMLVCPWRLPVHLRNAWHLDG